tara:strand:- start:662 stop:1090 length:429 start_codon:yes stop_codon:yes gene_type:complete
MRKVAGGEASAVPHTTFVGHSARQASTNPMILKQGIDKVPTLEETGADDGPWDEPEEGGLSESDLNEVWEHLQSVKDTLEDTEYQSISDSVGEIMEQMLPIMAQSGGEEEEWEDEPNEDPSSQEMSQNVRALQEQMRREGLM